MYNISDIAYNNGKVAIVVNGMSEFQSVFSIVLSNVDSTTYNKITPEIFINNDLVIFPLSLTGGKKLIGFDLRFGHDTIFFDYTVNIPTSDDATNLIINYMNIFAIKRR